jgi:hypothetical protein
LTVMTSTSKTTFGSATSVTTSYFTTSTGTTPTTTITGPVTTVATTSTTQTVSSEIGSAGFLILFALLAVFGLPENSLSYLRRLGKMLAE